MTMIRQDMNKIKATLLDNGGVAIAVSSNVVGILGVHDSCVSVLAVTRRFADNVGPWVGKEHLSVVGDRVLACRIADVYREIDVVSAVRGVSRENSLEFGDTVVAGLESTPEEGLTVITDLVGF